MLDGLMLSRGKPSQESTASRDPWITFALLVIQDHIAIPFIKDNISVCSSTCFKMGLITVLNYGCQSCMPKLQILAFGQKCACTIC